MRKGFTLIELLVVIAIIGILSTVAVVAFKNAKAKAMCKNDPSLELCKDYREEIAKKEKKSRCKLEKDVAEVNWIGSSGTVAIVTFTDKSGIRFEHTFGTRTKVPVVGGKWCLD